MSRIYVGRKVYRTDSQHDHIQALLYGKEGTVVAVQGEWTQVRWNDGTIVWELPRNVYAPTA